jgi:hypothetical protein
MIQKVDSIIYLSSLSKSVVTIMPKCRSIVPKMTLSYQVVGLKGLCTLPYLPQSQKAVLNKIDRINLPLRTL